MATSTKRLFVFYFLVSLVFGLELLWSGRTLFRWDTLVYNWPMVLETRVQIMSGHWPFWSDGICTGTPLLENINAGVLYPPRVLCWFLPLRLGYHLFLFFHLWLSFVGMHLFCRQGLRLGWWPAAAGALVYGASGYMRGMWDTHNFMSLPWIPLGLAALSQVGERGPARAVAGAALCLGMMILGGDFQAAVLWVPVACLLAILLPERRRLVPGLAAAVGLGLLLTAAQWVPALGQAADSYRAEGLSWNDAVERSFHPSRLLELFLPHAFGGREQWYGQSLAGAGATRLTPWTTSIHVGLLGLLAAGCAFRRVRRRGLLWAAAIAAAGLLLSFGRFLPGFEYWQSLPVIQNFRYPEKYLLWFTLGIASLAALGARTVQAMFRSNRHLPVRRAALSVWSLGVFTGASLASLAVQRLAGDNPTVLPWTTHGIIMLVAVMLPALLAGLGRLPRLTQPLLLVLLLMSLALPWYREWPTTPRMDVADPPAIARAIAASDAPQGRFLRDRAVVTIPSMPSPIDDRPSVRTAVLHASALDYNSPILWGGRSAEGFSPAESKAMRELRLGLAAPDGAEPRPAADVARFCRLAHVEWLLTTPARLAAFQDAGLNAERFTGWGEPENVMLARVRGSRPAYFQGPEGRGAVPDLWRIRPGLLRVRLDGRSSGLLCISETYARGWQAHNELGEPLEVVMRDEAFLGVRVPPGTLEVRLRYAPPAWARAWPLSLLGVCAVVSLLVGGRGSDLRKRLACPLCPAVLAAAAFFVLGWTASSHWSCTFDEGFHLARGLARLDRDDSRLSYFHPPWHNLVCGYFARLGARPGVAHPEVPAWDQANALVYAVDFAAANAEDFPEMVQASRWGTALTACWLCFVGVLWAYRAAGPPAVWLAAAGLAMQPALLAHGMLNTTDAAVTAWTVTGSFALWSFVRSGSGWWLWPAAVAFVLGAMSKFTGLIWFAAFLILCIPWAAWQRRRPALLLWVPISLVLFVGAALLCYGAGVQEVRVGGGWLDGLRLPAGRYVEGLFRQGQHALEGHAAYFHGQRFQQGTWWSTPVTLALKTPTVWLLGGLAGLALWLFRRRSLAAWMPMFPFLAFALLLCFANRMALGVRHALPVLVFLILAAAVTVPRLSNMLARRIAMAALALSSIAAAWSYPSYLSYFPWWAGGTQRGDRWLVDSNFDWGQNLDQLEAQWSAVQRQGGRVPKLVYFGFVDPELVYHMPVAAGSYLGFMRYTQVASGGADALARWKEQCAQPAAVNVASVSALGLWPHRIDFSAFRALEQAGRVAQSYEVLADPALVRQ